MGHNKGLTPTPSLCQDAIVPKHKVSSRKNLKTKIRGHSWPNPKVSWPVQHYIEVLESFTVIFKFYSRLNPNFGRNSQNGLREMTFFSVPSSEIEFFFK